MLSIISATNLPWTAEDYVIADTLPNYWVNFISTGNPNGGNLTDWPVKLKEMPKLWYLVTLGALKTLHPARRKFPLLRTSFSISLLGRK